MNNYNYSWSLASIGLVMCVIMLIIAKPFVTYSSPRNNNVKNGILFFSFLFTLNSIFAFWEWDTYHSWWDFLEAEQYGREAVSYYEPVFIWLAGIVNYNYFLWRTLIWAPSCFLIIYAGKRLDVLNRNFLLSIILFLAFLTCTRNILGISLLLLGCVLLLEDKRHSRVWGLALIVASFFFHRTMLITIVFAGAALVKQNRKSIILLLILYPVATILATYLIENIVSGSFDLSWGDFGEEGNRVIAFASQERAVSTIFGIIQRVVTYVPQYLALTYVTKRIIFDNVLKNDSQQRVWTYLMRFSFVCIYVASCFYFTETSTWIFERFKYMGMIPLTFVLAKVWSVEPKTNIWVKSLIVLQLFSLSIRWYIQYYHWS